MTDDLKALLHAIDIAAFRRDPDGTFVPVAPMPAWFGQLVRDPTFPFLGHILGEAEAFWSLRDQGFREFGPCAEVDDAGREFHYRVVAVTASGVSYLLFRLDPDAQRLREVLQPLREKALEEAMHRADDLRMLENAERVSPEDIYRMLRRLLDTAQTDERRELRSAISSALIGISG
jgi:hypothetical protein